MSQSISFSKYIAACIESNEEQFQSLLEMYNQVEHFKEKVLVKYFLLLKHEDKTLKLFQTFNIPITAEYVHLALKYDMYKLLCHFCEVDPVFFFSLVKDFNYFKKMYFQLLL